MTINQPGTNDVVNKETLQVVNEVVSLREKTIKHFLMSNGSYIAIQYGQTVHYKNEGKWEDIDNSLSSINNEYQNKKNDFKVKFAKKAKDKQLVKIQNKKYEISWGYLPTQSNYINASCKGIIGDKIKAVSVEDKTTPRNLTSEINYVDIEHGIDLQYILNSNNLKENIIVKEKRSDYSFRLSLTVKNLIPLLKDDGSIVFLTEDTHEEKYLIPPPFMIDANDELSKAVKFNLEKEKNSYILTIEADKEWINANERKFPVIIDPEIETIPNFSWVSDTYKSLDQNNVIRNHNGGPHSLVGNFSSTLYGPTIDRAYMKFSLPEISGDFVITNAKVKLTGYKNGLVGEGDHSVDDYSRIDIHEITKVWDDTGFGISNITEWENCYDHTILDGHYVDTYNGSYDWDITKLVKSWYNGTPNYGIMFKRNFEEFNIMGDGRVFFSCRYTDDISKKPVLMISYLNSTGLNSFNSYKTYEVENAGTIYFNEYTGKVTYIQNDVSYGGNRLNANINHVFNTDWKGIQYGFGLGWQLNITESIGMVTDTKLLMKGYYYFLRDEDGTLLYFKKDDVDNEKFRDEVGLGLTLTTYSQQYIITDDNGNKKTFSLLYDNKHYLTKVEDIYGNQLNISYNPGTDKPSYVTDSSGRVTSLSYVNGLLKYITDPGGRVIEYIYNANNELTNINSFNDTTTSFVYSQNKIMSLSNNFDELTLFYDSKDRFTNLLRGYNYNGTAYLKEILSASYLDEKTIYYHPGPSNNINGSDALREVCVFDSWGHKITNYVTNKNGDKIHSVVSNEFTQTNFSTGQIRKNNKLITSYTASDTVNYLVDPNFDLNKWTPLYWSTPDNRMLYFSNEYSQENSLFGNYNGKIVTNTSGCNSNVSFSQYVNLPAGTYTFSGYVKTENLTGGLGAFLKVYVVSSGSSYYSEYITETTELNINDEWQRLSVTFSLSTSSYVEVNAALAANTKGTVHFDVMQLENGDTANKVNLIGNSGFESTEGWSSSNGYNSNDFLSGNKSYKFEGDSLASVYVTQSISLSDKTNRSFILSGWGKANSCSYRETAEPNPSDKHVSFGIRAVCTYTDLSTMEVANVMFDNYSSEWQYASESFSTENEGKIPLTLTIYCYYDYNLNTAYFDNIQLLQDKTEKYIYDNEGNLTGAVSSDNKKVLNIEYNNANQPYKISDENGVLNYTTYDNANKYKIFSAYGLGKKFTVDYDSFGNVTKGKQIAAQITNYGIYFIYSSYDDLVWDIQNGVSATGTNGRISKKLGGINQQFRLKKIQGTEYFTISPLCAPTKVLGVVNGSLCAGATIEIQSYSTSNEHQQWKFEKNDDGSFLVVPRHAQYLCINSGEVDENLLTLENKTVTKSTSFTFEIIDIDESLKNTVYTSSYDTYMVSDEIVSNKHYYIQFCYYNLFIGNSSTLNTEGSEVLLGVYNRNKEQQIKLTLVSGESSYYLLSFASVPDLVFGVRGSTAGSVVELQRYTGATSQQWKLVPSKYSSTGFDIIPRCNESLYLTSITRDVITIENSNIYPYFFYRVDGSEDLLQKTTSSSYTPSGQYISSETDERGNTTEYTYNENRDELTSVMDAKGNIFRYLYNVENCYNQIMYSDKNKNNLRDSFESFVRYNMTNGRLSSIQTSKTQYNFSYLPDGALSKVQVGNRNLITYEYFEGIGNPYRILYGNGDYIDYQYDSLNRVSKQYYVSSQGTHYYEWKYDNQGNVVEHYDSKENVTTKYNYDFQGRLVSYKESSGKAAYQSFDSKDRINGLLYKWGNSSKQYSYTYNSDDMIQSVLLPTGRTKTNNYDALDRINSVTIDTINPLNTSYTYLKGIGNNTTDLIESVTLANGITYYYSYDQLGNITHVRKGTEQTPGQNYYYDELGQLTRENRIDLNKTYTYIYDSNGNILSVSEYAYTTADTLPAPRNVISYQYEDATWGDLLTKYNGMSITYDAIGNPLTYRNGINLTWTNGRFLNSFENSSYNISYQYDVNGLRTNKTVYNKSTQKYTVYEYFYQMGLLLSQKVSTTGEQTIEYWFMYDETGNALGFTIGNTAYYYIRNLQGDVEAITDSNGNVVVNYLYNTWGKLVSINDVSGSNVGIYNPIRYRGYYYDTETGLFYVGSRYYDPEIGRFINTDVPEMMLLSDHIIGTNLFAYCYNNPVMNIDPTGHLAKAVTKIVKELSVSAIYASYANALYTSFAATLTKIGAYVTGVLAPKVVAIFSWQPWLVVGILAAAAATVVTAVAIVRNQTIAKADANIRATVKKGSPTLYWSASLGKGCVDIGRSLTYDEALENVKRGQNVFTVTSALAKALAIEAGGAVGPEIDKGKENTVGYYYHYHVSRTNRAHIWYLFPI